MKKPALESRFFLIHTFPIGSVTVSKGLNFLIKYMNMQRNNRWIQAINATIPLLSRAFTRTSLGDK
jgi:hypothetical protein